MDMKSPSSTQARCPAPLPGDQLLLLACAAVSPDADRADSRLAWLAAVACHGGRAMPRRLPRAPPAALPPPVSGMAGDGGVDRFVASVRRLLAASDETGRRHAEDAVLREALALAPTGLFDVMRCVDDALAAMVRDHLEDAAQAPA